MLINLPKVTQPMGEGNQGLNLGSQILESMSKMNRLLLGVRAEPDW